MKKIFTLLALALGAATASAADYTDVLSVNVNGVVSEQQATISLNQSNDGSYEFSLKNFMLVMGESSLGIGTIQLNGVEGTTADGVTTLYTSQSTKIQAGDAEGVSQWMGPMLPEVPIVMTAKIENGSLYAAINIDMTSTLSQKIQVMFGERGYQLPNSGFENYKEYKVKQGLVFSKEVTVDEPLSWHSFASATGSLVEMANKASSNPHTFVSNVVRPGSTGSKSVLVVSSSALGIVANGTITTGRMNAGAIQANDLANHAELDMSKTETDGNGDPFYAVMNGRPDSLAVWVKYKQSSVVEDFPYATISAAITDGTYYQDPNDNTYKNVLATACDTTIESNGFAWQRISVPFNYVDKSIKGKAILVTISTNAGAGKGTTADSIYVDDAEFIYNASLLSAKVGGKEVTFSAPGDTAEVEGLTAVKAEDIETVTNANGADVATTLANVGDDIVATVKVTSSDLKTVNFYSIKFKNANVSGISDAKAGANDKVKAIYSIDGVKVDAMQGGNVYIVVYESGKTQKVVR